jgi:hypothetical protein
LLLDRKKLKVRKETGIQITQITMMDPNNIYPAMTSSKTNSSSKDESKTEKVTLMKLRRNNWTEWKKFFKNLLVRRGHEEIFNVEWCTEHANNKLFRKKSALVFSLLHSCLSADLKPIAEAADTFANAMKDLADTCGEKSLIKLGDKLYALIFCDFVPGTSITSHIARFQSLYTSLKSDLVSNNNMKVTSTMAGIFFLKSFRNNNLLSSLIQNMYDMVPFSFEKLAARMNIEHSQTKKLPTGSVNVIVAKSGLIRPNKEKFKAIPTSQRFCNVVPTKGRPAQSSSAQQGFLLLMSNSEIQKLIEQQIQMLKKLQVNAVKEEDNVDLECNDDEVDNINEYHPDDTGFFVEDKEDLLQVVSPDLTGTCLILDTGASKSTVLDPDLLFDLKPVTKHMKTYSGAIDVTHIGTMNFGLYKLFPIYFAPAGKCNLISVSQFKDGDFEYIIKTRCFWYTWGLEL